MLLSISENFNFLTARCDRYNHEAEEDTEDDSEDVMFYSFSSCSPRYIKFEELREVSSRVFKFVYLQKINLQN